jgi:NAD(P)-dependent dehydrogenase (short-subunit alcohol dehydrogenase family)
MTTRYAHLHPPNPTHGEGDARPTAQQIVDDNSLRNAWPNRVVLVTGTSSGIGIPTVAALASTGAHVYATARNLTKARSSALGALLQPGKVDLLECDTSSMASVRACAAAFLAKESRLDILVCNAGVMAIPDRRMTAQDNLEEQMATNYFGHFLLFHLLKDALLKGAAESTTTDSKGPTSRVVIVASSGHKVGNGVDLTNLNFERPDSTYNQWVAYGQSKTATILLANEIERRYAAQGIHALSLNPGGVWTGLQDHVLDQKAEWMKNPAAMANMKSVEQGAATTLVAAVDRDTEGVGAVYLDDCAVQPVTDSAELGGGGVKAWAMDREVARSLWAKTCAILGVEDRDAQ